MKNENINELNKKLELENLCVILALVGVSISMVANLVSFVLERKTDDLNQALVGVFSTAVLAILELIFLDVKKHGTPFAQSIIKKLKVMAIVIMVAAIMPDLITQILIYGTEGKATFKIIFGSKAVFIMWIGVIVGIISEIFSYGLKLQEDVDSIA